ncbi:MAG TPA: exosortase H [Thermoanaerobaculia bacterium]|nr:exosortase H [Thermoanaerobaculia bacterium]
MSIARGGDERLKRDRALFLVRFIGIVVGLYILIALNPVNDHVIVPFTRFITVIAGWMLGAAGQQVSVNGTIIGSPTFAVNVENGCNGIEAVILLIAAVAAFPARWIDRILGIILGFLAVQIVNTFRVAMLFWLGAHHPTVFQLFHVAVWQSLIILFSVGLFVLWSWKFAAPKALATSR